MRIVTFVLGMAAGYLLGLNAAMPDGWRRWVK